MLNSLRRNTKSEALKILNEISKSLLPSPYLQEDSISIEHNEVLTEIRELLKISSDDFSDLARAKIYKYIASELTQLALPSSNIKSVRQRVGQKGVLNPSLYQIQYAKSYKALAKQIEFRTNEIEATINSPEMYDHFFDMNDEGSQISLFTRTFFSRSYKKRYQLLVFGLRKGATIQVLNAWYLFSRDSSSYQPDSAIGLMKFMLDDYGLEMNFIIDNSIGKLFYSKVFTSVNIPKIDNLIQLPPESKVNSYVFVFGATNSVAQESVLGMAFTVDMTKYLRDLRANGVRVSMH